MKKTIAFRVEQEDIDWLDASYPIHGMKQWFFESCLKRLRKLHDDGKIETPVDLLTVTVMEVTSDL